MCKVNSINKRYPINENAYDVNHDNYENSLFSTDYYNSLQIYS